MTFQTDFPITDCHRYVGAEGKQTTGVMLYGMALSWNEAEHEAIRAGWRILFE